MKVPGKYTLLGRVRLWDGPIPGTHEPGFVEKPIIEYAVPEALRLIHDRLRSTEVHLFWMGECRIILALENDRWHISISCEDRHPTWDELKVARYRLGGPDLVMAMVLPAAESYVNVPDQDHVFHLWQLVDDEAEGW